MHRSWQKFDEMQHAWADREKEMLAESEKFWADATSALEQNTKLKEEVEAATEAAAEAVKELKETKETLRTCQLDRNYHKEAAEKTTTLNNDLQNNLQAETLKCEQLAEEVNSLKEEKKKMLKEHAEELEDSKEAIKICFYMFWKHNRNADFSYLGDAFAADEADCLERLAEEEAEAANPDVSPPGPEA